MANELAVIFDKAELDGFDPRDAACTLVFESQAHAELVRRGVEPLTPEALLGPAQRDRLRELDRRALEFWRAHGGLGAFDLVAYRHARWIHRLLYPAFTLLETLERIRPDGVVLLDAPAGHALDRPPGTRRMTALHALAAGIASMRGLPCRVSASPGALGAEPAAPPAPAAPAPSLPADHVLLIGSGAELRRHAAIARAWRDIDDRPVIHVYQSPDDAGLAALAEAGEVALPERAYTGEPAPGEPPPAGAARARFDAAARASSEPLRAVFANPGLGDHFRFLFGPYAQAMAGNAGRWRHALGRRRPGVVVSSYPTVAVDVAASLGLPTLILPHGAMMTQQPEYHALLPAATAIAAVGRVHADLLAAGGVAPQRIHVTGVVGAAPATRAAFDPPAEDPPTLLVPTSESCHPATLGMLPATGFAREAEALRELLSSACVRGWRVVIRPHPRYDRDPAHYRALAPRDAGDRVTVAGGDRSIREAASRCSAVVFAGAPSSVLPEASAAGRPVYILRQAALFFEAASAGLEAWPSCATVADLVAELGGLLADPAHRARRAAQSDAAARAYLGPSHGSPETATAEAIARVAPARAALL